MNLIWIALPAHPTPRNSRSLAPFSRFYPFSPRMPWGNLRTKQCTMCHKADRYYVQNAIIMPWSFPEFKGQTTQQPIAIRVIEKLCITI